MTLSVVTTLQQWILFLATAGVVGCTTWHLVVRPGAVRALPGARADLDALSRHVASVGVWITGALVAAWILRGVVQVWGFRDPFVPLREDVSFLLFETFWGTIWMAQGLVIPILGIALWRARGGGPVAWGVATLLTLALVSTLALSSHAMGVDSARPLFVAADGIHALGAGAWIGSLAVILIIGRPSRDGGRVDLFAAQIRAFSPLAMVSVAGLVSMGVVLAWTHLEGIANLWATGYGRVLSAKVAVAGVVLGAGFRNWRVGIPRLDSAEGAASVQQRATTEVSLAIAVLLLTAVLVHSAKP